MDSFKHRAFLGVEAHVTNADHARALSRKTTHESSVGRSSANSTATYAAEVRATKLRIQRLRRGHLDERGTFVKVWDGAVVAALWFVTFVTPVEVCFWDASELLSTSPVLLAFNRLVDVIFIFDIAISFFVPYRASRAQGGVLITDNRRIARHYLRGWFVVDFVTSLPFDDMARAVVDLDESTTGTDVREFRVFKMFRLFKLMRILRASRILNRWQDRVSISWGLFSLLKVRPRMLVSPPAPYCTA